MARIPEAEIERLKGEVSLARLVEAKGIALARHGADLVGRCPFHEDKTPSLVVSPRKNLWHCLGACQTGGSVIDWVMRTEGLSFRHAVDFLRDGAPSIGSTIVKRSTVPKLPAPVSIGADDQALLNQVVGFYHSTLKASPEALRYLQRRDLVHPELVDRFRLGFANRTLGVRLPNKNRKTGAVLRERLTKIGILRESGHEHFNGCVVVPILDEAGNVTEVYGRKITENLKPGLPIHLYLPGPHRGVWNGEVLAAAKEIIVCEALIDAMTFWCAGYRNVTAAYGIEGFTDEILAAFKRYKTERVLIAYDRDDAGERAAEKLAVKLIAEGIECWRIHFPKGVDANEYALKVQPAVKSLGVAIRKALWLGKGKEPERSEPLPVEAPPAVPEVEAPLPTRAQASAPSSLAADLAAKEKTSEAIEAPSVEHVTVAAAPIEDEPLAVSPVPAAPSAQAAAEVKENEILLAFGSENNARRYRIRGLAKNLSYELLKVNVLASRGDAFHVDTIDLYAAKQRAAYVAQAAAELHVKDEIVKADLGRVLLKLEELQEQAIKKATAPKEPLAVKMEEAEREAALDLLRSTDLLARVLADLEACGLVGEKTNKLVGYLAAVSRKLDSPLAVLVQSSSAAGKSTLMEAVLAFVPEEDRVQYSAMTGQSLFYLGTQDLKHKVLAIAEEEGAARAAYALKLLSSEGELTIASTGKDPATGNLVTQEYRVEGPVMLFTTTTAMEVDEELKNRCLVLGVDESREQTQAIHRRQRDKRTLEGLLRKARREELTKLHQNAQRLLRPLDVLNPYAQLLTFPDQATRTRRDHEKYLTLIDTIALLHQSQREVRVTERDGERVEYIEATAADVRLANELAHDVLGRSLDELPPQTRRLLLLVEHHVGAECKRQSIARAAYRFSRRALREAIGWGDTQLKLHLGRLVDLEYLVAHRASHGAHEYELVYDGGGGDGAPYVPGLIDAAVLDATTTTNRSGINAERSAPGRGPVGPWSGGGRVADIAVSTCEMGGFGEIALPSAKTRFLDEKIEDAVVPLGAARRA
jgi:DNA primase